MLITKLIRMLHTKLCALSRSINHLWVVIVPLSVDLLTANSFWENSVLLLINYFLLPSRKILSTLLFETLQILLSWSNNCFLWILGADVVVRVSFCACNSITSLSNSWLLLILIHELELLLGNLILILDHLLHSLSIFIKRYLYSSIWISYVKTWVILLKAYFLLTLIAFLRNSWSKVILGNLFKPTAV